MPRRIENKKVVGIWVFEWMGGNHVKIYVDPDQYSSKQIAMTGSDVAKQLPIDFTHRINKILFTHTSSAGAELPVMDNLAIKLSREDVKDTLIDDDYLTSSRIRYRGQVGDEYEASLYTLTLNSTSTDLVIPTFYVQKIWRD